MSTHGIFRFESPPSPALYVLNSSLDMHMCTQITVVSIDEFSDTAGFMDRTDPYVSLTLGDETYKTTVKDNAGGKNVVFDEKLSFNKQLIENILQVFLSI